VAGDLKSGEVLQDQTRRELVYRPFQFNKHAELFIRANNEAISVVAVRVNDPECPPVGIHC
jgi:hypothetical protein